jgi:hypothetical protein
MHTTFGKRKRDLGESGGGGVGMRSSSSSPNNDEDEYPYFLSPRTNTLACQYSPHTHECCDDADDADDADGGSKAIVSCTVIVDTSYSLIRHNTQSSDEVVSSILSRRHDGYVPSFSDREEEGETDPSFTSSDNSASPFTSEDDDEDEMGAETSSCASTSTTTTAAAFIDDDDIKPKATTSPSPSLLLSLGRDIMVSLLRFLEPTETLCLMTVPLCKEWRRSYTAHQDMWKTLCCQDPFSAKLNNNVNKKSSSSLVESASSVYSEDESCYDENDDDSFCALGQEQDECTGMDSAHTHCDMNNHVLCQYRLLYTSFVRCIKYLKHIQEDAHNGRPPSEMDLGTTNHYNRFPTFGVTKSLKKFLAKKKDHVSLRSVIGDGSGTFHSNPPPVTATATVSSIEMLADNDDTQVLQQVGRT